MSAIRHGWRLEYRCVVRSARKVYIYGKCERADFGTRFADIGCQGELQDYTGIIVGNGRKKYRVCATRRVSFPRFHVELQIDFKSFYYCSSFLINTSDRIIRVYDAKEVIACGIDGEPEPIQKLQDQVNKYVD